MLSSWYSHLSYLVRVALLLSLQCNVSWIDAFSHSHHRSRAVVRRRLHCKSRRCVLLFQSTSNTPDIGNNLSSFSSNATAMPSTTTITSSTSPTASTSTTTSTTNSKTQAQQEAERLRQQAQKLYAEAEQLRADLQVSQSKKSKHKTRATVDLVNGLFRTNRPLTAVSVARRMRDERWSTEQAIQVLTALYDQWRQVRMLSSTTATMQSSLPKQSQQQPLQSSGNQTEAYLIESYMECFMEAAEILDNEARQPSSSASSAINMRWSGQVASTLKSILGERKRKDAIERQKRFEADIQAAVSSNASVEEYVRRSLGLPTVVATNMTTAKNESAAPWLPLWIPSAMIPLLAQSKEMLNVDDVKDIKDKVLTGSSFYCTSSVFTPSATLFRGNLRLPTNPAQANSSAIAFADIQNRMQTHGFHDRIQLFLLQDPEWNPTNAKESKPKPVLLAVPSNITPALETDRTASGSRLVRRASFVLSLITTAGFSISCYALNPSFFESVVLKQKLNTLSYILPLLTGILLIQGAHELAHYLVARKRKLTIGRPMFLPSIELGIFGCLTPLRSFPKDRIALFDFALSGPLAGLSLSLLFMMIGLNITVRSPLHALQRFPVLPVGLLKSSLLTGGMLSWWAPKLMMLPHSQPIPMHPLFVSGFTGLLATAVNMLPVFRLDGGRMCTALVGHKVGALISTWTVLLLLSTVVSGPGLSVSWLAMILLFHRRTEVPARDEVSEVDSKRWGSWITCLTTAVLALVPFPGGKSIF
jgi:Zn-dependent protease